jgi:hypothetical protein
VLTRLTMLDGMGVSGLESDQGDLFYAGGRESGRVRAVRKPRRGQDASRKRPANGAPAREWNWTPGA